MKKPAKIGYLVPQFPGQTHIFFWREILALEALGTTPVLFSTRRPPQGLIAHSWSAAAIARTRYLASLNPLKLLAILPRLPFAEILQEAKTAGPVFLKDVLLGAPAAAALARACRAQGITHVHVHSCGRAALVAALAARAYGLGYSLSLHGPLSDYGSAQGFKWRRAKFVSVITRHLLNDLPAQLGNDLPAHLPIQPMGVDTEYLQRSTPYQPPHPGEPLRLFSCGRLNIVKGHQDLLQAVRLMLDQGHNVQLDIAGEDDAGGGGYHRVLDRLLLDLNLQDHVRLLGAIDADAVADHLKSAHIFVLASWHEPLGVAYMEAMSCGTPTVGTNAGGVPELITHDVDGILVPPKDPATLADTLTALAADPARCTRIAAAGRARVVAAFDSANGAEMLLREIARETP